MNIGIIGGSGLYNIDGIEYVKNIEVDTPYGKPSDSYAEYRFKDHGIYFLPRHGWGHNLAPHAINYRANIHGFKELKINKIISVSATGGITKSPGAIVVPDNAIDMTHGRLSTFFDESDVYHIDLSHPFCGATRKALIKSAESLGINISAGVSICTNGPRLETAAEIKAFSSWGADIVGMTLFPECTLAREAGICYTNISVVTNHAAGRKAAKLTADEVTDMMQEKTDMIKRILQKFFSSKMTGTCICADSLNHSKISK